MPKGDGPTQSFRRIAILAVLDLFAVLILAQVQWNILNNGTYGLTIGVSGGVHAVDPGGPAARNGIVVGDRVDMAEMRPLDRMAIRHPSAGESVALPVWHRSTLRSVVLQAQPYRPVITWGGLDLYGYPLLVFITLCLATAVVLMRPGTPAWTYYAFVWFSTICAFQDEIYVHGAVPARLAMEQFYQIAFAGAFFSLTLFSTRLFNPERRWQVRWETTVAALLLLDWVVWEYLLFGYVFGWRSFGLLVAAAGSIVDIIAVGAVLIVLSSIVRRSSEDNRQRAVWIFVGLSLQPALIVINGLQQLFLEIFAGWSNALTYTPLYRVLEPWAALAGAFAVCYALVSERIIDIRFAIGRATGYAVTSVLLVLFMAVAEWAVGELFADSHVAAYATLAAAILAAFSFNGLHKKIDALLDLAFFRREYFAEQRLRRAARALAFAASETTVVEFLLDEPVEALELSSAALFQLDEDAGEYLCTAARAWPNGKPIAVAVDDRLIAELRSEREPLSLDAIGWSHADAPDGPGAPLIAVPALARSDLYAFVLYGSHREGATLNPDERSLLGALVTSAAATFDHLDARRARDEIDELKRRLGEKA
jgi:hypothetical protein